MIGFGTYFGLEIKMMIKKLPLILLGMVAFSFIIVLIAGTGTIASSKKGGKSFEMIKVGIVGDLNDKYINIAIQSINSMESMKHAFDFRFLESEEEAQKLLDKDDINMLFIVPPGYIEGFMHGENKDIEVRFSEGDTEVSYYIFAGMADFATTLIVESERNIYTLEDYYKVHNPDEEYDAWYDLNKRYLTESLARTAAFADKQISATDDLNYEKYYLCNGIILIFLLLGMICAGMFREKNSLLDGKLNVAGIGYFKRLLSKLASFVIVYEILYIIFISILIAAIIMTGNSAQFGGNSALVPTLISGMLTIIPICTFILFIYEITGTHVMGVFTLFVMILVFGLLSGCFYPIWFMPKTLINISDIWLFRIIFNYMQANILGRSAYGAVLGMGAYVLGMIAVLLFTNRMKEGVS